MSTEELQALYTKEDLKSLQIQARIDQIHGEDLQKLEKIRYYCEEHFYHKIGIAYGYHARVAAGVAHLYLASYFHVESVMEYIGGFSREKFFTVRGERDGFHPLKNPIAQAKLLHDCAVDFLIIMDLDPGVDTLLVQKCSEYKLPMTFLHLDM